MPQHVGMDSERRLGGRPKPRHHPAKGNCGHRSAALAHEGISSGFLFVLEMAQGSKFDPVSGWTAGIPFLSRWTCNPLGRDQLALTATNTAFPATFMSRSTSRSVRY